MEKKINKIVTKDNVLDFIFHDKDNEYHFKFPGITKKLIVKLSGNVLYFKNHEKYGEGVQNAVIEELKAEAWKAYEVYRRSHKSFKQVS